jgi:hypothetical protein
MTFFIYKVLSMLESLAKKELKKRFFLFAPIGA